MIEELCEYLIRYGWDEDDAEDVHAAYYENGLEGVKDLVEGPPAMWEEQLLDDVLMWQKEVGED